MKPINVLVFLTAVLLALGLLALSGFSNGLLGNPWIWFFCAGILPVLAAHAPLRRSCHSEVAR